MKNKKFYLLAITLLSLLFTIGITFGRLEIFSFLIIFSLIEVIFYTIFKKIDTLKVSNSKMAKREFIFYSLIIIIPLIIAFLAYYPGGVLYDTITEWEQVQSNVYNNWHPIFHILISFKLPSLIYNNIISCTIFQLVMVFLVTLYFAYFLRKNYLDFKKTSFVLSLFVLNPIIIKYSVTLQKDTPYSYALMLLTLVLIDIIKENDKVSLKNKILFIISSLGVFLFRHNGLIPFLFVFLALLIFYPKLRKFLTISLVTILIIFYVGVGSIFNLNTTGGKSEMLGVILGEISYYYNNGVKFNQEELKLMDTLIPLENWKENYNPRNFNYIKWTSTAFNEEANKTENFLGIIKIYLQKSFQNPSKFILSYLHMTSPIWEIKAKFSDVDYGGDGSVTTDISKKLEMENISNKVYQKLTYYNNIVTYSPLRLLFINFGDGFFLIIVSLYLIIKKSKTNLKKYIPFIPVILNTLVIMLLITGEEYRFVYSEVLCCYPLLMYALYERRDNTFKSKLGKILKRFFIEKTDNSLVQFIRYFFVGGVAAVVNIGMLYVFTEIFHIYYVISNILAFTLGLIVNYLLSKKLVFQENVVDKRKEFIIYALIGVIGMCLDTLLVLVLSDKLKIYYMLSKIISTMLVFIWNFLARKIFYKIIK